MSVRSRPDLQTSDLIDQVQIGPWHHVHPQAVIRALRDAEPAIVRLNGWLADHIVAYAGTMAFFWLLCLVLLAWPVYQNSLGGRAWDPYPYQFLFFVLGGIMQSLFVPTVMVSQARAAQRDRIADEANHRAQAHLYEVNDDQLARIKAIQEAVEILTGKA